MADPFSLSAYGDAAVMVGLGPDGDVRRLRAFRETLLRSLPPGVVDVVAGLESLLVELDPLATDAERVAYELCLLARAEGEPDAEAAAPREFVVPIVVDETTAPDLADVARELGEDEEAVIARIEASVFEVALLAAAMAPMMDGLDVPSPVRRQATPRTDVPQGSVMIAGRGAIIQPFPGPTGWRVVGRTPLSIVDIARESPVSFDVGDVFRFRRVTAEQATRLAGGFLEPAGATGPGGRSAPRDATAAGAPS